MTLVKKLFALALLGAVFTSIATAQVATVQNELGFAYAVDYSKWVFQSSASVASGAQTATIRFDAFAATPSGRIFYPLATNAPLLIDLETSAVTETVTPSAVTCTQNSLQSTCSFTATFTYAHTGNFSVRSGTYGICEAKNDIANTPGVTGGTVVVANGFGGSTTTITSTAACAATGFNLLDVRTGAFQFYAPSSTAFVASTSPFNTATTAAATVTSAIGAPYFYTGAFSQATNGGFATVAGAANTSGAKIDLLKTRSTSASGPATTTIVTGDDLAILNAWGADGTNYINSAAIEFKSAGTIGATRVPSQILFKTGTDAAPTVLTTALTLDKDQSATFAGNVTDAGTLTFSGTATITKASGALTVQTTTSGNVVLSPAGVVVASRNVQWAKGAGVTAAGDTVLTFDGNYFVVGGNTTINGFTSTGFQDGTQILVRLTGTPTVKHNTAPSAGFAKLMLTAGGDVSGAAGMVLGFVYDSATPAWYMTTKFTDQ